MRLQSEFPYLKEFKERFPIDDKTIFAYKEIYSNYELPPDIQVHEETHLKQQEEYGAEKWIKRYLIDSKFRFEQEVEAFKAQVNHFKDRNQRFISQRLCAKTLSSDLYGGFITFEKAMEILNV